MANKYTVIFSKRAENNLDDLVYYLESEWSERIKHGFLEILKQKVALLREMPFSYQASTYRKNLRRCVVTKHTSIYYQIVDNEIEVVTIQDNRKKPKMT